MTKAERENMERLRAMRKAQEKPLTKADWDNLRRQDYVVQTKEGSLEVRKSTAR